MTAIHDKIAKLLTLAKDNANEHEAETALRLATALMMKHNIDQSEIKLGEDKPEVTRGDQMEADKKWHHYAANVAEVLYSVRSLWLTDKFVFVGRADNVDAAQMTYIMVCNQVEALYKINLPRGMSKMDRAAYRRDFKLSCAMRAYTRAHHIVQALLKDEEEIKAVTGSTALVVIAQRKQLDQEIEDFFSQVGGVKTKASRAVTIKYDSRGTQHGLKAGEQVQFNRSVK